MSVHRSAGSSLASSATWAGVRPTAYGTSDVDEGSLRPDAYRLLPILLLFVSSCCSSCLATGERLQVLGHRSYADSMLAVICG